MIINKARASEALHCAAEQTAIDAGWRSKVERLSRLCEEGVSKTHIAFLGTSILARAVDPVADLIYIKPRLAPDNPHAYSARSLCHGVLVPVSAELNFDIGVTGREPLNNQPYFRMTYLGDETPVHAGGKAAFDYMVELVNELNSASTADATKALAAFVKVRREYAPKYAKFSEGDLTVSELITAAIKFVAENSEGGKRAQAVAAGLVDVFAGPTQVLSGRINDPSRKFPGDVCVLSDEGTWEKSFEVRDKPVNASDVMVFARKCVALGVREAAVVMASASQEPIDVGSWAEEQMIGLTMFYGLGDLAHQCFFWSDLPSPDAARLAAKSIHNRLIEVEVDAQSVVEWNSMSGN